MKKCIYFTMVSSLLMLFFACGPENVDDSNTQPFSLVQPLNADESPIAAKYSFQDGEFPVACFYIDPNSSNYGQSLQVFNAIAGAWEWAKTPLHDGVLANGTLENGFVITTGIYGFSDPLLTKGKRSNEIVASTQDELENICQKTIDNKHPGKGYKLYQMAAYASKVVGPGSTRYPLVIGENTAPEGSITRMIVFGDSLSDTGRLKKHLQVFPASPYYLGRFSNGPVWNDYLGEMANISVVNLSQGGAVSAPNIPLTKDPIQLIRAGGRNFVTGSVKLFIDDFLEKNNQQIKNPQRTLFVIWVGANDYLASFDTAKELTKLLDEPDAPQAGSRAIAHLAVSNIINSIEKLYAKGARNFLVGNLPDLGIAPDMDLNRNYRKDDKSLFNNYRTHLFATKMSEAVRYHNNLLKESLRELQLTQRVPGARIVLFDAYEALKKVMEGVNLQNAKVDYGIDLNDSFITIPGGEGFSAFKVGQKCFAGGYLGSKDQSDICKNANRVLFWDGVHPTSIGHCGIAYLIHERLKSVGFIDVAADINMYRQMCKPIRPN